MNPKISITGAHSVGKTTLAKAIARHTGLPLIGEMARLVSARMEVPLDKLRIDLDAADLFQDAVFKEQVASEAAHDASGFVADRCCDFLAYSAQTCRTTEKVSKSQDFIDYVTSLKEDPRRIVFFVRPHESLLKPDGFRAAADLSSQSVWQTDGQVMMLLRMHGIRYHEVSMVGMRDRVDCCLNVINLWKAAHESPLGGGDDVGPPQTVDVPRGRRRSQGSILLAAL